MKRGRGGFALTAEARSEIGRVRQRNEDSMLVVDLATGREGLPAGALGASGALLVVCDGLGGAVGGDVASAMAARAIADRVSAARAGLTDAESGAALLREAVLDANRRVYQESVRNQKLTGMGTTATVALVREAWAAFAQVGDSRAYLLRAGGLHQLTRDQSLVVALLDTGVITASQAETLQGTNILLQAVGTEEGVQVATTQLDLCRGDTLLLCSDGLTAVLSDDQIRDVLSDARLGNRGRAGRRKAVDEFVERVYAGGAPDNVTTIVIRVEGDDLPDPPHPSLTAEAKGRA
ncbi:MAG: protein phosphatase 2C domain-containing protein [Myxococcota bacterium]